MHMGVWTLTTCRVAILLTRRQGQVQSIALSLQCMGEELVLQVADLRMLGRKSK